MMALPFLMLSGAGGAALAAPGPSMGPADCRREFRYSQYQDLRSDSRYRLTPSGTVIKISLAASGLCTAERPSKAVSLPDEGMELGKMYPILERFEGGANLLGTEILKIDGSYLVKITTGKGGEAYRSRIAKVRSIY